MRKLSFLLMTTALVLVPRSGTACSMCHCGDPTLNLVGSQVFVPDTWHVGFDTDFYSKDQVAEDDPTTREREDESRFTFSVSRTFASRLTLVGRVPISHRSITSTEGTSTMTGLSDPELLAYYRIYGTTHSSWLSLNLGLRSGWGKNDAQVDGERAEEHLQPGTGAAGVSPGLTFSQLVGSGDVSSLFGSLQGRFNGRNDVGYQYGDVLLANLAYERRLAGRLNGVVEMNFRSARRDEEQPGEPGPNTGVNVLYVSPRLLLRSTGEMWLRAGVQIPVWKDLYGDQDEHVNVLLGLTFKL